MEKKLNPLTFANAIDLGLIEVGELRFSLGYDPDHLKLQGRRTFEFDSGDGGPPVTVEGDVVYVGERQVIDENGEVVTERQYQVKVTKAQGNASPVHSERQETFVSNGDGPGEGAPAADDNHVVISVEQLKSPSLRVLQRPDRTGPEEQAAFLGSRDQRDEHLLGLRVENRWCGHAASSRKEPHPQDDTRDGPVGRGLTLEDVRRCRDEVLDAINYEVERERAAFPSELSFMTDYRAKWKRDAVLAFSRLLQTVAERKQQI